jgi:hypothetical protein
LTTVGIEVPLDAPKPYGLALSPGGAILATINSGASRFSISLVRNLTSPTPTVSRINVSATFMGITFPQTAVALALSQDARYLYVAEAGINAVAVLRLEGEEVASPNFHRFIPEASASFAAACRPAARPSQVRHETVARCRYSAVGIDLLASSSRSKS